MARMGMDVDAVEEASRALKAKGADLGTLIASIEQVVRQLPGHWQGKDANDFVNKWWPQHKGHLVKLRADVEGLGQAAWNNAQEQRRASGPSSSPSSGGLPVPGGMRGDSGSDFDWNTVSGASWIHGMADLATNFDDVKVFHNVGLGLAGIGVIGGLTDVAKGSSTDDAALAASGSIDATLSAMSLVPGGGVIAGTLGVAKSFVDETIPYTKESQEALYNWQAQRTFGVDAASMSAEQASQLNDYYAGASQAGGSPNPILGGARMLSDKMNESYDEAVTSATSVAQPVINWVGDSTGWF